ncbi:MAG: VCBS repeat-containing protein, partial [Desulfamplus sp.]|nr:VCBS repeat-containing protein [Desulfamplus sp.]
IEVTGIKLIGVVPQTFTLLHVADMNGSGNWDLVFLHPDSRQMYIYHLNANLSLDEPKLLGELSPDMVPILAADLTGDGRAELILRNMARGDLFMAQTGSDGWEKTLISALPLAYEIAGRGFFNQDAMADLIVRHAPSGELWVAYMNGPAPIDGHFAGIVPVAEWRLLTVADFNGNGLSDTLWMHIPSRILYVALTGEHLLSEAGTLAELPEGWEILE